MVKKKDTTELLSVYWDQRLLWSTTFNKPTKPTITEVHKWLKLSFRNIGNLTALLICGDLIEAGILSMPAAEEWGGLIHTLKMGSKETMERLGLIRKGASKLEVSKVFVSLDLALRQELKEEEKEAMNYNVIMLEHTLCKIKRLSAKGPIFEILQEI